MFVAGMGVSVDSLVCGYSGVREHGRYVLVNKLRCLLSAFNSVFFSCTFNPPE